MALVTKRIYRISGNHSALNAQQIGVESSADADLGFKMYGGKDDAGDITKFLAKGKPGILSTLNLSGGATTGDTGILRHDALGDITGGQMTVATFNTYISDGGFLWTKTGTTMIPLTDTDTLIVGDGTESAPGYAFDSSATSGIYYGTIATGITGLGVSYSGAEIVGFTISSGDAILYGAEDQDFSIIHERVSATGTSEMLISNSATQSGVASHLTIQCTANTAVADITIDSQAILIDAYNDIDMIADLGTITIQAKGTTLGGVVIESDWFEFQNYTAYDPIPVWNSNTQWAAYESQFGTEYPILQAIVDNATASGSVAHNDTTSKQGGTTAEYYHLTAADYSDLTTNLPITTGHVVFGGSGGELNHSTRLFWDAATDELKINNGVNRTNWYDAGAAAISMTGTATQGMVISSDKILTVGSYSATSISTSLLAETSGASTYTANVYIYATKDSTAGGSADIDIIADCGGGEGGSESAINIISKSQGISDGDHIVNIYSQINSVNYGVSFNGDTISYSNIATINHTTDVDIDYNTANLTDIGSASYTRNIITVTTNDFTLDPDNGLHQFATITANSTWDLSAPTGGSTRTTLIVYNSDASDHTLTITGMSGAYIHWLGSAADGFTCVAGEYTVVTAVWDTTNRWLVSVSASIEESF